MICTRSSARIERWFPVPKVAGSNPAGCTSNYLNYRMVHILLASFLFSVIMMSLFEKEGDVQRGRGIYELLG